MSGAVMRNYRKPYKIKLTSFVKGKRSDSVSTRTRSVRPVVNGSATDTALLIGTNVKGIIPSAPDIDRCAPRMEAISESTDCRLRTPVETKWDAIRKSLQVGYIESSCLSSARICVACKILNSDCTASAKPAVILCEDCGPSNVYCEQCCCKLHSFIPFHVPKIWIGETFVPVQLPITVLKRNEHNCGTQYSRCVTVVDCKGRQHETIIECCICELPSVTLIRHRLWPSSPLKPNVAFMLDVMELQRVLQMEAQVSVLAFCSSLHHLQPLQNYKVVKNVYRALIRDAADEFLDFTNSIQYLKIVNPACDDGSICPACPKELGKTQIISVDANFGLVRKRNGGQSTAPSKISTFFLHQDMVDQYVEDLQENCKSEEPVKECNDFKAGNKIRSSVKTAKLDETAVFGAMCRHEYPKAFCNIKKGGEKLGYSMCLLEHLKEDCGAEINFIFMYDIACIMKKYLHNRDKLSILSQVTLAVPIFHSYGHKMACQIKYNPRRISNAGLADGECLERLWAYLRKFADMTKSMSTGRRTDVLSSALLHYASKARNSMGRNLVCKLNRATELAADQEIELGKYLESSPGVTLDNIARWSQEEHQISEERKNADQNEPDVHTWQELHAYKVHCLSIMKLKQSPHTPASENKKIEKKCQGLEKQLKKMEKDHGISGSRNIIDSRALSEWADKERVSTINKLWRLSMERKFTFALVGKHAEGQSATNRLMNLTRTVNKNMRAVISSYNSLCDISQSSTLPNNINFESVTHDDWPVWQSVLCDMSVIPTLGQRQAIDAYNLWCRAKEEKDICKSDMLSMIAFLKREHNVNCQSIDLHRASNSILSKGAVHFLIQKVMSLELEFLSYKRLFADYCECDLTDFSNFTVLLNCHQLPKQALVVSCDEKDELADNPAADKILDEEQCCDYYDDFEDASYDADQNNDSDDSCSSASDSGSDS